MSERLPPCGVPEIIVPDNLKAAVTRAHRYEPEINRTYATLARHYGFAIIPARAAKPRDKAKVRSASKSWSVGYWPGSGITFFSLAEVNTTLAPLLLTLNARPFKKLPGSRQQLFETLDRPALRPLPVQPFEYAEWKLARVNIDYHVEVDGHYYSVPYALVKQQLDVRLSAHVVELFTKANAWPVIDAPCSKAGTVRSRRTCRPPTNAMPNGRPSGSSTGRPTVAPRRRRWSKRFSPHDRIRNRGSGPV